MNVSSAAAAPLPMWVALQGSQVVPIARSNLVSDAVTLSNRKSQEMKLQVGYISNLSIKVSAKVLPIFFANVSVSSILLTKSIGIDIGHTI